MRKLGSKREEDVTRSLEMTGGATMMMDVIEKTTIMLEAESQLVEEKSKNLI